MKNEKVQFMEVNPGLIKLKRTRDLIRELRDRLDPEDFWNEKEILSLLRLYIDKIEKETIISRSKFCRDDPPKSPRTTTLEIGLIRDLSGKLQKELHKRASLNRCSDFQKILDKYTERRERIEEFVANHKG